MKTSAALRKRSARPYEQIVIEGVRPAVEHGRFPVKAIVGELYPVEVSVFRHGSERVCVALRVRRPSNGGVLEIPMQLVDPSEDLWHAEFLLDTPGRFSFTIAAWTDRAGRRDDEVRYDTDFEVIAERPLARTAAWFELPADLPVAEARLPELHELGFDVVCLRTAGPAPDSFDRFVHAAGVLGIEVGVNYLAPQAGDDTDWKPRWNESRKLVRSWVARGVRMLRVEQPADQPIGFWSWLIEELHREAPEVIFLAGEVPHQPMMRALGRRGFTLSVACFSPRGTKTDVTTDMSGLAAPDMASSIRPSCVVDASTPDVGGEAALKSRLALAGTLSPSYGVRGGAWLDGSPTANAFIRALNLARRGNTALQHLTNLRFLDVDDESLIAYVKSMPDHSNSVIVVVNLDPLSAHQSVVHVPEESIGLARGERYQVEDVLSGGRFTWSDRNEVRLDPGTGEPAKILVVRGR